MKFINRWSYGLADYLSRQLGHNHEKRHVYYYGFQIIVGGIVKFVILLLATLAAGIFFSTFTALLFFAPLRIIGGGYHMNSYLRCMLVSSGLFMIIGFVTEYTNQYWSQFSLALLTGTVFLIALPVTIKWAPADTPYKPITKASQKKVLKILSVIVTVIWAGVEVLLISDKLAFWSLAGSLGILLAVFMISPAGYAFFDFIGGIGRRAQKTTAEL